MTPILAKLDELKALSDKATPGPWARGFSDGSGCGEHNNGIYIVSPEDYAVVRGGDNEGIPVGIEKVVDADFIAASRTAMPQLVEALRVAVVGLVDWDNHWHAGGPGETESCTACQALTKIQAILEGK